MLHCLMQAKMEPGNVNPLQLSPTVQATRSNYTQVHRGTGTRYLEYFVGPTAARCSPTCCSPSRARGSAASATATWSSR